MPKQKNLPGTARQLADDDEDCRDDGFERQTRQECQIVSYPDCHIEDKVKYRTEIVPQCKTRLVSGNETKTDFELFQSCH